MRILFAGNKERGVQCLRALAAAQYTIIGVIAHPLGNRPRTPGGVADHALQMGIPLFQPDDVNHPEVIARLRALAPDLTILAGYGPIVKQEFIDCAPLGCINLHGGKLPQYRGSSPMNWALINGDCEFTLSIIRVDTGVDTGDVLIERTFPIGIDDTIADLQATANRAFPEMLLEVLSQIQNGTDRARKQESAEARYFPLRFPEDGLILWDLLTAEQVHNKIRALTDPYPGAFTYYQKRRVKLLRSTLMKGEFHGEPGRVYRKSIQGLLVCAMDRCLWIQRAYMEPDGGDLFDQIQRYDKLATVRDLAVAGLVRDGK